LQAFRQHAIIALEEFGCGLFNFNVMADLVDIFKAVAMSDPAEFDRMFWEYVSAFDNLVASPAGQDTEIAQFNLKKLLRKYPATTLMANIDPLVRSDWFVFHQCNAADAYATETKFLRSLLHDPEFETSLYFTNYETPILTQDWVHVIAQVELEEVTLDSEHSAPERPERIMT